MNQGRSSRAASTAAARDPRYLGPVSLGIAVAGAVAVGMLTYVGVLHGPFWKILLVGLEAATVGGLADWFAVTAMFRRVPVPFLSKHTDILVKSKDRIALAMEQMVARNFFNKEGIDKLVARISASQSLLDYLEDERNRHRVLQVILAEAEPFLVSPRLSEFLAGEFQGAVKDRDVATFLGDWIPKAVAAGYHQRVLAVALDVVREAVGKKEIQDLVEQWLTKAGQDYKDKGWWKSFVAWLLERTGAIEYSELADSLVRKLDVLLRRAETPASEIRQLFDERLLRFAERLRAGDAASAATATLIANAILDYDKMPLLIGNLLRRIRKRVQQQALSADSELMRWLANRVGELLYDFKMDVARRRKVDEWTRSKLKEHIQPDNLGGIVREYLSDLPIGEFRDLIEGKVGGELQWIRLNGAVIGGLVGILLGVARHLFF